MCETNPIPGGAAGWNYAKQTQFRLGGAGTGAPKCAKQTQFGSADRRAGSAESGNVQNEPNSRRGRGMELRQTNPIRPGRQAGRDRGERECAKRTQFPAGPRDGVAPNKPNLARPVGRLGPWRAKMCETKPIWPRLHPATGWNDAKQTQSGPTSRDAGPLGERGMQNKTPTTKVAEWGSDPRFRADIADRFG